MSNVSEELLHLRKRARRRLVGAIALVIFALIVLWTALDGEPPANLAASRPVEIVSSSSNLASAVIAVPVAQQNQAQQFTQTASQVAAAATATPEPVASLAVNPAASKPAYRPASVASAALRGKLVNKQIASPTSKPARDPRQILEGRDETDAAKPTPKPMAGKFFVQVAAFAEPAKAAQTVAKLKHAGLPAFSEKVKTARGELTRVRIGPATERQRAAEWLKKAQNAGVSGQVVGK